MAGCHSVPSIIHMEGSRRTKSWICFNSYRGHILYLDLNIRCSDVKLSQCVCVCVCIVKERCILKTISVAHRLMFSCVSKEASSASSAESTLSCS